MSLPLPHNHYQLGWVRGQVDLVAALLDGRLTVDEAAKNLGAGQLGPKKWLYGRGWFDGQMDLIHALRERHITVQAAALNLGMRTPDELPREQGGL